MLYENMIRLPDDQAISKEKKRNINTISTKSMISEMTREAKILADFVEYAASNRSNFEYEYFVAKQLFISSTPLPEQWRLQAILELVIRRNVLIHFYHQERLFVN